MGLPSMKKPKKPRHWTPNEEKTLEAIAGLLGTNANLSSVWNQLEKMKAEVDHLRVQLAMPMSPVELTLLGMPRAIERLRQSAELEAVIQKALSAYPFRKARLSVAIGPAEGRFSAFEAKLSAHELANPHRSAMPFTDIIELRERKSVILDQSVGEDMVSAVTGLVPRGK